ncbi:MAG: hypothetical protein B6I34_04195, partial [Anaerolineaceae bacterium 4572_32.1]
MTRYALYLGCTVPVRGMNYEMSARKVAGRLDIELVDVDGFSCCGFPAKPLNCTLTEANHRLKEDAALCAWANEQLAGMGHTYKGKVRVRHFARMLYEEVGVEALREAVTAPLEDFGFAQHYGCHYLKPSHLFDGFDDPENPQSLARLIEATGARVVRYEDEGQCCGGGILGFDEETALVVTKQKLDHIAVTEADALVLICPFCAIMYEANQRRVEKLYETSYKLPVLYYPQILGLAMGFSPEE